MASAIVAIVVAALSIGATFFALVGAFAAPPEQDAIEERDRFLEKALAEEPENPDDATTVATRERLERKRRLIA